MPEAALSHGLQEGTISWLGQFVARHLYGRASEALRPWLRRCVMRVEQGPVYSYSVRQILARFHGLTVGMYTIGPCESEPDQFAPGMMIGRYCSIYYTVRVLAQDGPRTPGGGPAWDPRAIPARKSPPSTPGLKVGHDVYIGHNATILPSVRTIGHGAVIGAGSVVHEDVPAYAVVTGNPARVVRYRFRPATIERLLAEQWWLKPVDALLAAGLEFQKPLEEPAGRG